MNRAALWAAAYLLALLPAQGGIREEAILLEWQGRSEITSLAHREPRDGQELPESVSGTLGPYHELLFKVGPEKAPRGSQYLDLLLPGGVQLEQFTVACYVYPTRRNIREELLSGMGTKKTTGFALRNSWGLITFEFGDGKLNSVTTVHSKGRSNVALDFRSWQHVAVVFDQGVIRVYKNGLLIQTEETGLGKISLSQSPWFRLGAHPWAAPNSGGPPASAPFEGRMTGLFISGQALDEEEIFQLMETMICPPRD